jgi:homogentisate 1,2-dioxygenase
VFHGSGVMESVFGKLPYRAEDYIVIPRGITYRLVPDKLRRKIISFSNQSVRFGFRSVT